MRPAAHRATSRTQRPSRFSLARANSLSCIRARQRQARLPFLAVAGKFAFSAACSLWRPISSVLSRAAISVLCCQRGTLRRKRCRASCCTLTTVEAANRIPRSSNGVRAGSNLPEMETSPKRRSRLSACGQPRRGALSLCRQQHRPCGRIGWFGDARAGKGTGSGVRLDGFSCVPLLNRYRATPSNQKGDSPCSAAILAPCSA